MIRQRRPQRPLSGAEKCYCLINLLAAAVIFAAASRSFFYGALAAAVLFVHITGVILLSSGSIPLRTSVLLSCLTAAASLWFLPVIAVNWLILLMQTRRKSDRKNQPESTDDYEKEDTE